MASSDVNLVQVANASIASCDGNVFKLDIHVVFRLQKLSAVRLPRSDLKGNNMSLRTRRKVSERILSAP